MIDDVARQRAERAARDAAKWTPNCSSCLHPMTAVELDCHPVWRCEGCGTEVDPGQRE
ncbi:MAG: hypothetical protein J0I43_16190 [Microbacterium sp.]|uniref:hypothetical protein n=1 Tax=Microbacterium sp. TaxID=51671 RepID=UPI001ACFC45A|nr:hypothetical protein [Microbacterium sp.]MBN9178889.1 hypothetical protein [Microbacterium sp.]